MFARCKNGYMKFKFWKEALVVLVLVSCALLVRQHRLRSQAEEVRAIRQPRDVTLGRQYGTSVPTSTFLFPSDHWSLYETTQRDFLDEDESEGCSTVHVVMVVCDAGESADELTDGQPGASTGWQTGTSTDASTGAKTRATSGAPKRVPTRASSGAMFSLERQLDQVEAALKSAVLLSTCPLMIHIVSHSKEIFNAVLALTRDWPQQQLNKVTFEFHETWFPPEQQQLRSAFRPCSAQRLFLPRVLESVDAVLYMDTDYLFLRPPQRLWEVLGQFSPLQVAAGASPRFSPEEEAKAKSLSFGFNAGLLLLNLTRLRAFPGGWEAKVLEVLENDSVNDDQKVLNYIFEKNRDYLHQLDCRWNFRHFFCTHNYMRTLCPSAAEEGAFGVHGVTGAFQSGEDAVMRALYLTWWNFDMSMSKEDFILNLKTNLASSPKFGPCHLYKNIAQILTYQLEHELSLK